MEKERYEAPALEVAHFAAEDVITSSNELEPDPLNFDTWEGA